MTENVNQGVKVSRVTILTIPDYVLHIMRDFIRYTCPTGQ
jgi:hypothetical protein